MSVRFDYNSEQRVVLGVDGIARRNQTEDLPQVTPLNILVAQFLARSRDEHRGTVRYIIVKDMAYFMIDWGMSMRPPKRYKRDVTEYSGHGGLTRERMSNYASALGSELSPLMYLLVKGKDVGLCMAALGNGVELPTTEEVLRVMDHWEVRSLTSGDSAPSEVAAFLQSLLSAVVPYDQQGNKTMGRRNSAGEVFEWFSGIDYTEDFYASHAERLRFNGTGTAGLLARAQATTREPYFDGRNVLPAAAGADQEESNTARRENLMKLAQAAVMAPPPYDRPRCRGYFNDPPTCFQYAHPGFDYCGRTCATRHANPREGAMCVAGCPNVSWNGQPGEHCSRWCVSWMSHSFHCVRAV